MTVKYLWRRLVCFFRGHDDSVQESGLVGLYQQFADGRSIVICRRCGRRAVVYAPAPAKSVDQVNAEMLAACRAALQCIALLTPFPTGDPLTDPAINRSADRADKVRAKLRRAIANAEVHGG